jgi:hypothetical protein
MNETSYKCPVCKGNLSAFPGDYFHPGDSKFGVKLECTNRVCPAQEVMGHGTNEKNAYEVITDRFKGYVV